MEIFLKMKVIVKYFATIREIVGKREDILEMDGKSTVKDLLVYLSRINGEKFKEYIYKVGTERLNENLQFLVDGRNINTLNGINTKLHDGCKFVIIPPVGGGS
jgi:molybdopterin synthase sulfur carrier subunit